MLYARETRPDSYGTKTGRNILIVSDTELSIIADILESAAKTLSSKTARNRAAKLLAAEFGEVPDYSLEAAIDRLCEQGR